MPQDKAFINGALMPRDPSARSPVIVMAVEDADATVDRGQRDWRHHADHALNPCAFDRIKRRML